LACRKFLASMQKPIPVVRPIGFRAG